MFPDDDVKLRGAGRATTTTTKASGGHGEQPRGAERDGGGGARGMGVVAVGGQRGTLYDSFELNAMVVRLNRLLNGESGAGGRGVARRPRSRAAGSWIAAPKALFRRIKGAFLGGRRGDG